MTSNFYGEATRRDSDLVTGLCQAARTMRMELREWTQTELNAALLEAQLQQPRVQGVIQDQIVSTMERLNSINRIHLPEAVRIFDDVIIDVSQGGYTDVYNAYDQLQMGCGGLVRIVRDLLEIRLFIGEQEDS